LAQVNRDVPVVPICLAFKYEIPLPSKNHSIMAWERSDIHPGNFSRVANQGPTL
jgi:hypothetical protein